MSTRDGKKPVGEVVKDLTRESAGTGGQTKADPTLEGSENDNKKFFTFLKWTAFVTIVLFAFMLVGVIVVTIGANSAQSRTKAVDSEDKGVITDLVTMIADANIALQRIKKFTNPFGVRDLITEKLMEKDEYKSFLQKKDEVAQAQAKALEKMKIIQESGIDRATNGTKAQLIGLGQNKIGKYPLEAYYPAYQSSYYGTGCHVAECNFPSTDNKFLTPKSIEECMKICVTKRIVPAGTVVYGFTYNYRDGSACYCKDAGGDANAFFTDPNDPKKFVHYRF